MTTMRSFLPNNYPLINALTCCANSDCGKKAAPLTLKMCTACRSVSYCNVDCQKTHRKDHKHQCNKDMLFLKEKADLLAHHDLKEKIDNAENGDENNDDDFFKPIPPNDDCPICTLPLPVESMGNLYSSCCGNSICCGCYNKYVLIFIEKEQYPSCAFCRKPAPSSTSENIIRYKTRMEVNDSVAIFNLSNSYNLGQCGLPKDRKMAFKLCLRAAKLGNSDACSNAANYYAEGVVVPKDMAKVREYTNKAVKKGNITARHNLGWDELNDGNIRLASRHWLISAAAGCTESLQKVAKSYRNKIITKQQYSAVLVSYVNVHKDEWSIEREEAERENAAQARRR